MRWEEERQPEERSSRFTMEIGAKQELVFTPCLLSRVLTAARRIEEVPSREKYYIWFSLDFND